MAEYRIVKYCRFCKKRMLLEKWDTKKNYCDECQARISRDMKKQSKEARKKA